MQKEKDSTKGHSFWSTKIWCTTYIDNKSVRQMTLFHKKKLKDRTRIRVYGFHSWLNYNPVSWLVEILKWEKGVIIWLHRKGGGHERNSALCLEYRANVDLSLNIFYFINIIICMYRVPHRNQSNCYFILLTTFYSYFKKNNVIMIEDKKSLALKWI